MKFKPTRTDRLSPEEREIVDRLERGVIDAAEAGRLLIASVQSVRHEAAASPDERMPWTEETDAAPGRDARGGKGEGARRATRARRVR